MTRSPRWLIMAAATVIVGPARGGAPQDPGVGHSASTEGAERPRSFAELDALVRDPNGPSVIELAGIEYRGDLEIKRPVIIRGERATVLTGTQTSSVITVEGTHDVTIESVHVRSSGHRQTTEDAGIKVKQSERVHVANVEIEESLFGLSLLGCHHCVVEDTRVTGWGDDTELRGDGVKLWESHDSIVRRVEVDRSRDVVVWYTRRALLEDVVVTNSRYGAHFMYAHDGHVHRSRFEKNVVGVFVMYSMRLVVEDNVLAGARGAAGIGLGFKDSDTVTVRRNWIVSNTQGTYLDNTPRTPSEKVTFEANLLALNDVALGLHSPGTGLVFQGNDFHQNARMLEADGGGDALAVDTKGNCYSDYEGYDLNHDGNGDVPYELKALSSELTDSRPALKFFQGTAAMGLIDAVARAVPVLSQKRLLVDPMPLMIRPSLPIPPVPPRSASWGER